MFRKQFTSSRGLNVIAVVLSTCLTSSLLLGADPEPTSPSGGDRDDDIRVTIVPRVRPEPKSSGKKDADVKVDVKVVLIPVTVTDSFGKPLPGLPPSTFKLFENGVEQHITYFSNEDAPMSVGLLFDASGSMEKRLDQSRTAVGHLFNTGMEGDEYFLVEFNDTPKILCGFTRDSTEIQNSLNYVQAKGWTSLFDAVYLGVNKMKRARNSRRALIVLSDGADNNSRYTESEIRSLVRESDVVIYAIGIMGGGFSKRSAKLLADLATETGGKFYPVNKASELPEAIAKISATMREQYVLGYSPLEPRTDGKYQKVQVKLFPGPAMPPLHATWRVGYYAPFLLY